MIGRTSCLSTAATKGDARNPFTSIAIHSLLQSNSLSNIGTQGSATLHPGLSPLTPSACSPLTSHQSPLTIPGTDGVPQSSFLLRDGFGPQLFHQVRL